MKNKDKINEWLDEMESFHSPEGQGIGCLIGILGLTVVILFIYFVLKIIAIL